MGASSRNSPSVPFMDRHAIFIGTFVHSQGLGELEYLLDTTVAVSAPEGVISAVEKAVKGTTTEVGDAVRAKLGWAEEDVDLTDKRGMGKEGWFFPGFIDTHIHAPQYPNIGLFGKTTLLDWLNTYTFPMEAAIGADLALARRVYWRVVSQTLSHGTTTASYYATISVNATNLLTDICIAKGQRAFVGRVCMDTILSPETYRDPSVRDSLAATMACADYCSRVDPCRTAVVPIVTPRFAPSCTKELLSGLGAFAKEKNLPIQTHISENVREIELVRQMFPDSKDYADVYDTSMLLTPRTVLAHAIHLSPREISLLRERRCGISHCPVSNSSITSGEARIRHLTKEGIGKIGLGTDVSAGYSPSMLVAARHALLVSRHVAMKSGDDADKLSVKDVLWLATQGGAEVMGMGEKAGSFEVGKSWDAQFVSVGAVDSHGEGGFGCVDLFGTESLDEAVQKWFFNGDDRNTTAVWVRGRLVHTK